MPKVTKTRMPVRPRATIEAMEPYRPPSSGRGKKMRLDFNENTVGCSPRVVRRLRKIAAGELAVYPEYEAALPRIAAYFGVRPDQLTLTNGTDEAIQLVVNTYVDLRETVVLLRPSYAMYRFYAQIAGARLVEVDYASDLSFPHQALMRAAQAGSKAIFIANPNNPTGTLARPAQLKQLLDAVPHAAVMIDEAYFEFSGLTVLPWIARYKNLFVSRTFSKIYGLAAMRCGCLFSDARNIEKIRKGQSPYSVNSVAVACALEAIKDPWYVQQYLREVVRSRRTLCEELDRQGWKYFPSEANFVLVEFGGVAREVQRLLGEEAILVRDRSYELPGCVRITVGTQAQTRRLIGALRRVCRKLKTPTVKSGAGAPRNSPRPRRAGAVN